MGRHYSEGQLAEMVKTGLPATADPHLSECVMCRDKYAFMVEFQQQLQRELDTPVDSRIAGLASMLLPESVIPLHRYRSNVDPRDLGVGRHTVLLAAQNMVETPARFTHEATYAAEPDGILVRVVKDRTANEDMVHVLSDNPAKARHVLVLLRDIHGVGAIATNADGVARLPKPLDWEGIDVSVLLPVAVFPLKANQIVFTHGSISIDVALQANTISMNIVAVPDEPLTRAVAVCADDMCLVANIAEGKATFAIPEKAVITELRLFN